MLSTLQYIDFERSVLTFQNIENVHLLSNVLYISFVRSVLKVLSYCIVRSLTFQTACWEVVLTVGVGVGEEALGPLEHKNTTVITINFVLVQSNLILKNILFSI